MSHEFWRKLDELVQGCELVIDRPQGSMHPHFSSFIYPLDYGYLAGTSAADGGGIDIWIGSSPERQVTGIISTVDLLKRDVEMKILLGCTPEEAHTALAAHQEGEQSALLIERQRPE